MGQSPAGDTYNRHGDGLPLLNGPTDFGSTHPDCSLFTTDSQRECEAGDLIFCVRGSTTGRMNWADRKYSLGRGVCAIRAETTTETRFVRYCIEDRLHALLQLAGGGTFPNLTKDDIEKFAISWPDNRARITGILLAYDELIENNQRRISILEKMASALYREWFVEFRFPGCNKRECGTSSLGDIPQGWKVQMLNDAVDDIVDYRGKTPKKLGGQWSDEGILALSALNVKGGRLVNLEKSRRVSEDLYSQWMKNPLRRGDILMTSEAPLGELFFLCKGGRYCLSQRLFSIRANHHVIAPVILYLCMESEKTQDQLRSRASGATVSGIRQSELRKVLIVVPPRPVQERAEPILLKLVELKAVLEESLDNLRRTRHLLLPWLLSGTERSEW